MLENFHTETFTEHVNTWFRFTWDETEGIDLELIRAQDQGSTPWLEQFSLYFQGPHAPLLAQRTYQVNHEKLGSFDLFITPIARNQDGLRYEAAFTRHIQ